MVVSTHSNPSALPIGHAVSLSGQRSDENVMLLILFVSSSRRSWDRFLRPRPEAVTGSQVPAADCVTSTVSEMDVGWTCSGRITAANPALQTQTHSPTAVLQPGVELATHAGHAASFGFVFWPFEIQWHARVSKE